MASLNSSESSSFPLEEPCFEGVLLICESGLWRTVDDEVAAGN